MASSYATIREQIFDYFEAVANQTQCGGMSLRVASSLKRDVITAEDCIFFLFSCDGGEFAKQTCGVFRAKTIALESSPTLMLQ